MKTAQLILKVSDISNLGYNGTFSNPIERTVDFTGINGYVNRRQSQFIWRNINLRDILGDLYESNCNYKLELVNISFFVTSTLGTFSTNETDRVFNVYMSGLPNQKSYSSLGLNQEALLTTCRVPTGAFSNLFNYNNNFISFKTTSNQFCDLTITFRNLLNNNVQPQSTGVTLDYPYSQFTFNITKLE